MTAYGGPLADRGCDRGGSPAVGSMTKAQRRRQRRGVSEVGDRGLRAARRPFARARRVPQHDAHWRAAPKQHVGGRLADVSRCSGDREHGFLVSARPCGSLMIQ